MLKSDLRNQADNRIKALIFVTPFKTYLMISVFLEESFGVENAIKYEALQLKLIKSNVFLVEDGTEFVCVLLFIQAVYFAHLLGFKPTSMTCF